MTQHKDNNFIDELGRDLSGISLTTDEKQSIRANLEHTLPESRIAKEEGWLSSQLQTLQQLPHLLGKAAVGTAAVLFLLGGLTYAAEDALPGTPLYAVKTHVNEAFINITAVSNSKAAATQSKLAARRINELQTLVNNGSLTTTTSQKLLNEIAEHTKTARQNIASLESANETKGRQAAELRSQLTALLAAESETLESNATATTSANGDKAKLAQQAARKLIAIADSTAGTTTVKESRSVAQSALNDLLQLAVDRLDNVYGQYQERHNVDQTPPPRKLVTAAHDLENSLTKIQGAQYSSAVTQLQSLLVQLDDMRRSYTVGPSSTAASKITKSTSSRNEQASSSDSSVASLSQEIDKQQSSSSTQPSNQATSSQKSKQVKVSESDVTSPIPSKQNLHNAAIRDIIAATRSYLEEVGGQTGSKQETQAASSSNNGGQGMQSTTASTSTTASSSGPQ